MGLHLAGEELAAARDFDPSREKRVIHATVVETWASRPDSTVLLVESAVEAQRACVLPGMGRLLVRENSQRFAAGDRISFWSYVRKPENRGNPGEYDWELYCRTHGVLWTASTQGPDSIVLMKSASAWNPRGLVSRMRNAVTHFIEAHSAGDVRAVLKGIVVGDRGEISQSLNRSYTDSGLVHVLSASGLHVGFAAAIALPLAALAVRVRPSMLLRIPYAKIAAAASILPMVVYCFLAGARVPIVRATIMGMVVASAILLDRRWYSINSLAVAGVVILLAYPLSLFAVDFQLSFAAVLGIVVIVPQVMLGLNRSEPRIEAHVAGRSGSNFREALARIARSAAIAALAAGMTTLAATVAVSPILMAVFHVIPLYGVAANVAAIPLLTPALPLALAGSFVGLGFPRVGALLLVPAEVLVGWTNHIAEFVAGLPFSTLHLPDSSLAAAISGTFVLVGLALIGRGRSLVRAGVIVASGFLVAAAVVGVAALWKDSRTLTVVFFNVGKADAAYVKPPGSEGVLIDGGLRTPHFDAGESILVPYFRRNGIRRLEGIVMSHPDSDHIGGLLSVVRTVPPTHLWFNAIGYSPRFLEEVLDAAYASGARVLPADRGYDPVRLGLVMMTFLNPRGPLISRDHSAADVNNASVVCRLDYGEVSFLFTGDLAEEGERELVASGAHLRSTVLKVGHHGCRKSTTKHFVEAVQPAVAVISCDSSPRGSCPDAGVLADLEAVDAKIFWTGRDRAVTIETDGKHLSVKTGKKSHRRGTGSS